jgi:hypothetical protein
MRVAIIGSRDYPDRTQLDQAIAPSGYDITAVLCGGARGPDSWGKDWAEQRGIPVVNYPADWGKYGRSAGMVRNAKMIANADAVIALWDGVSRALLRRSSWLGGVVSRSTFSALRWLWQGRAIAPSPLFQLACQVAQRPERSEAAKVPPQPEPVDTKPAQLALF